MVAFAENRLRDYLFVIQQWYRFQRKLLHMHKHVYDKLMLVHYTCFILLVVIDSINMVCELCKLCNYVVKIKCGKHKHILYTDGCFCRK